MQKKFNYAIVSGFAALFALCLAGSANAAVTLYAGSCGHVPAYPTIQLAVNNSAAGGIVKLCPGIYPEQVEINKNLTLEGFTVGTGNAAVIAPPVAGVVANTTDLESSPPNPLAAQIYVHDAASVSISDVTVDGTGNDIASCSPNLIGIYYQDASGIVNHVVMRYQDAGSPADSGCQWGLGFFAESGISLETANAGTSTVTVENSSVHDFQKNGITGNAAGTTLTVTGNQIRGQGPTTGAAENGIQLGFGATGNITNNTVIDEIWAPDTSSDTGDAAAGILVFDVTGTTVSTNHVGNAQFGIAVAGDGTDPANNATIATNTLDGTLIFDAIDVCGSTGGTIRSNTIGGSTQSGIHLDGTCAPVASGGTSVTANVINEGCAGILNNTAGNTIAASNTYYSVVNTTLAADTCTPPLIDEARLQVSGAAEGSARPHPAKP